MKLTHNWLKDFVDIKISPQELAPRLTMAGLEVTSLEKKDDDWVYEIEVTSNRPDLLSVIGIAREVAVITGRKLSGYPGIRVSGYPAQKGKRADGLTIDIQDKKDCPLYTAKIIENVKVRTSPDWLKKRLELIGLRPVNNIVDITNYVLLSLGQPLHAFDLDKIVSQSASQPVSQLEVIVRRARDKEEIVTIDGIKRILNDEILVIASEVTEQTGRQADRQRDRPIAIAGIMGGKDTEVTENTRNILLESAQFNPLIIRRARQRLGISSESSYRFERDIDINMVEPASQYAAKFIIETAGGSLLLSRSSPFIKRKNKILSLNITKLNDVLGVCLASKEIKDILKGLAFKIKRSTREDLKVEIPSFRKDISQQIDLIEEVARFWGYERTPSSIPDIKPSAQELTSFDLLKMIRETLIAQGLNEVITYSLISKDILKMTGLDPKEAIEIANPLSNQQEILRPQLLPSLLIALSKNINQEESVSVFEIAKVFKSKEEQLRLGIALCGVRWLSLTSGRIKDEFSLLHLKGIIEKLFNKLGIKNYDLLLDEETKLKKSYAQLIKVKIAGRDLGYLGQIRKEVAENFDIKEKDVFVAELYLDKILPLVNLSKVFKSLPLYPSVRRDISLLLKEDVSIKDVLGSIKENASTLLKEIEVVDYYKGRQVPDGYKAVTLSCRYLSDERTLTNEEVSATHSAICDLLKQRFFAQIR